MPSKELSNSEKRRMEAMKDTFTVEFLCDQHVFGVFHSKGETMVVTAEQKAVLDEREDGEQFFTVS